ncbi:MAG: replication initiator protein A [Oscillospiraceae bacterium]|nr:replication initiator protein A [Oscillospiraceae bacterium]
MAVVTAPESYYQYPEWLMRLVHSDNSKAMIQAAEVYIIALSRLQLSIKNGFVDKFGKTYIHFTYEEIKKRFKCGTTKCWQMLKKLKQYGLITVKYQGFGLPMMIYVHGSAVLNRGDDEKTAALKKAAEYHNNYAFLQKESFEEWQERKITAALDEKTVGETDEVKEAFAQELYNTFKKAEQKRLEKGDPIVNKYGYLLSIIKNAKLNKSKLRLPSSKPSYDLNLYPDIPTEPSYDVDLLFKRSLETTPVVKGADEQPKVDVPIISQEKKPQSITPQNCKHADEFDDISLYFEYLRQVMPELNNKEDEK